MTASDMTDGELTDRVACVTGATSGLGREIARTLARAGADIVLVGRDAQAAREACAEIAGLGRRGFPCPADVRDADALAAGFGQAGVDPAAIDILVCAAGLSLPHRPIWEYSEHDYRRCFDLNVLGVMNAVNLVLPGMMARGQGAIVAIGGTYGHRGVAKSALYAASKWALRGLIKSIAAEAGASGVTANIVAPGGIDGENLRAQFAASAAREGLTPEAVYDRFAARSAMACLVSEADVAALVRFVVSPDARRITGQDLLVDAGTVI